MGLDSLKDGLKSTLVTIQNNPVATALGATGVAGVAVLGTAAIIGASKSRKNKRSKSRNSRKRGRRIKHTKRGWKQDRARKSKQKWEVAYRRRKRKKARKSKKRGVHYTKNGQPYIILSSGKARFIKGKRRKS